MSNLKACPKREVLSIERTGSYPNVQWNHILDCGHVEQRKRKAPAAYMACPQCKAAKERGTKSAPTFMEQSFTMKDEWVAQDQTERRLQIRFARALELPLDAVAVIVQGGVAQVQVFLEAHHVERLARP